jgi:hypothetical protein
MHQNDHRYANRRPGDDRSVPRYGDVSFYRNRTKLLKAAGEAAFKVSTDYEVMIAGQRDRLISIFINR